MLASRTSILQPQATTICSTPRPTSVAVGQAQVLTTSSRVPHLAVGTISARTQPSAHIFVTNCQKLSARAAGCSPLGGGSAATPTLSSTVPCLAQPSSENISGHNLAPTGQHPHLCQRLHCSHQGPRLRPLLHQQWMPRLCPHRVRLQLPPQPQRQRLLRHQRRSLRQSRPLP